MKKINRMQIINRDEWLVNHSIGKSILHVGCTDYPITKSKIAGGSLLHSRLPSQQRNCWCRFR